MGGGFGFRPSFLVRIHGRAQSRCRKQKVALSRWS
jgi:hypothetical protein